MNLPNHDASDPRLSSDPIPLLREIQSSGRIVRLKLPLFGNIPALTRYEDIDRFLRDHESFARDGRRVGKKGIAGMRWWMPSLLKVLAKNMMAVDEPDHRRLRGLVEQAFARRSIESMGPSITRIAEQMLRDLESMGKSDGQVDLMKHFCRQFPLAVICELLGLPDEDRPKFTTWFRQLAEFRSVFSLLKIIPGLFRAKNYLHQQVTIARKKPGDGLISQLVQANLDGETLSDDELVSMVFLLLVAGHETTTHLIANGLITLLDHPDEKQRLLDDWGLAETAIDEMLRYCSPVQLSKPRYVVKDTEFAGHSLKRGTLLMAFLACGNIDAEAFPDPERFDITRRPNRHLTFGRGIHICLGLKLAKSETAIAFRTLFDRYPDARLAVPRNEICWNSRAGLRSIRTLPVKW